jgi:tetratricopeptide (TPR) repeat protein
MIPQIHVPSHLHYILFLIIIIISPNFIYFGKPVSAELGSNSSLTNNNESSKELPDDIDQLISTGYTLLKQSDYAQAMQYFNKALSIDPTNIDGLSGKGWIYHDQDKFDDSIRYFDRALDIDSNHRPALAGKGSALFHLGKYNEAINYFDKALAISPTQYITRLKGSALFLLGKYNEAINYFDKALAINSTDDLALFDKGVALLHVNRADEAIDYFDRVLAINSTDDEALLNKGVALYYTGKYNEAINYYDRILAINSTDTVALVNKGVALYDTGKYNEAINYYDKALAINSTDDAALANKALALVDMGNHEKALSLVSKALESNPSDEFLFESMAYISYNAKQYTEAAKYYKKALDIDPDMRSTLSNRELTALDGLISVLQSSIKSNTNKSYFYEKNGISVQYPSTWKKQQNATDYNTALFFPSSSPSSATIAVSKHKLNNVSNVDPQQVFDTYSFAIIKYLSDNFNITSINNTNISNSTAYEVDYSNGRNASILWTFKDGYIYSIIYASNNESYLSYKPVFKDMINSFTIRAISKSNFFDYYNSLLQRYLNSQ